MKTNYFLLLLIISIINMGCQNKTVDLASIKLGGNTDKSDFNYSLFKKVPSLEADLIDYFSEDNKNLVFANIPLDNILSAHVIVYQNQFACLELSVKEEFAFQLADTLLQRLGTPTAVFTDQGSFDSKIAKQTFQKFHNVFPDYTKWVEDEMDKFEYPYLFLWINDDVYHIFSVSSDWNGKVRNQYHPLTRDVFVTGRILGYLYPLPIDSPLYEYMK